jgi:hypothetical protein
MDETAKRQGLGEYVVVRFSPCYAGIPMPLPDDAGRRNRYGCWISLSGRSSRAAWNVWGKGKSHKKTRRCAGFFISAQYCTLPWYVVAGGGVSGPTQ